MKAKLEEEDIFVKWINPEEDYALVTKDPECKSKIFKIDLVNIKGLGRRDINKLKKVKKGESI